ncbi:MAG TPA: hypothetical protein DCY48_01660 [Candidatus Magasanikbacteria bacterium]|nr:MAG: hypothetical protein A3I74_00570 [Candidatus Magasanikbacteria bacterium RIFCSPLOWO2_02_FULL_47_16]OGH80055.1 MAG: hypothetical protein A3C10_02655 [Candidatus Magasanikbacteria bacterium RIFCSPHIGHO2_02_FULL_48_18]OGH82815.1 MAG: hypothetical protein A3G08_00015 [Candidatus Magasanikbacteria bacterium RIFCSPLOWO2_12_FULL_47_9b]HAZ28463.1 hypothetical protein [Candidatus Magasanikbacteria bacterium]
MAIKIIEQKNLRWINVDTVDAESLQYLKENFNFHHLDLEDIQGESQTPKIDVYKNYLFIVLQFPHWSGETQTVIHYEMDIFIGENFLVTIQHIKSKEIKKFFYRCMKNKSIKRDWMSKESGYLLYRIIESLFRQTQPILNNIGKQISDIENEIFNKSQDNSMVHELARHRRNILNFRRIIDPQRYLVANLSHTRKSFLNEEMSLYFDNVNDYLSKLWSIVEAYKDTLNGLHVTVESLVNQRTNKLISSLTVISVSLLPLTLLSGIYGMNIDRLPFAHQPIFVWGIFVALGLFILLLITIMRRQRRI